MAFSKRGVAAERLSGRVAKQSKASSGVVPIKPTAYDTRREAAILAKAASDEADSRHAKLAVAGVIGIMVLSGLYSLAKHYLFVVPV